MQPALYGVKAKELNAKVQMRERQLKEHREALIRYKAELDHMVEEVQKRDRMLEVRIMHTTLFSSTPPPAGENPQCTVVLWLWGGSIPITSKHNAGNKGATWTDIRPPLQNMRVHTARTACVCVYPF